jgi:hypothetical protein
MQILAPLLPYLLLAANTVLLLALFFGINQRVRQLRTRFVASEASLKADAVRISSEISKLNSGISSLEASGSELMGKEFRAPGMNSTLRGKVLKMHRLGQSAGRIAETLRVPRGEVELLVKVHAIVMHTYEGTGVLEPQGDTVKKG